MRELSLFTGGGGGLLGTMLLGWTPIGYVEYDDYCQRVIAQRIADGYLPQAPIFGDIREFVQSGAAAEYRGFADVVTGGFPCQPFSGAGKRLGADDPRNMWPETVECLRLVRPKYAFLENVPGLVTSGYFGTILGDLAESGYDARWRILSAAELGAPHRRDRLWIAAYASSIRRDPGRTEQSLQRAWQDGEAEFHTNPRSTEWRAEAQPGKSDHERPDPLPPGRQQGADRPGNICPSVADANRRCCDGTHGEICPGGHVVECSGKGMVDTAGSGLSHGSDSPLGGWTQGHSELQSERSGWWATEPDVCGMVDELSEGMDEC